MKKNSKLEFIKQESEIDFISQLILNILQDTNQRFLFLKGDIGSGKTTLVKSIAKYLKEDNVVISPTFNKMFVYNKFVHIDGYNFKGQDLRSFEDYFEDKLVIIEWPENIKNLPNEGFVIEIIYVNDSQRKYLISWKVD